jgi:hypothetical protein
MSNKIGRHTSVMVASQSWEVSVPGLTRPALERTSVWGASPPTDTSSPRAVANPVPPQEASDFPDRFGIKWPPPAEVDRSRVSHIVRLVNSYSGHLLDVTGHAGMGMPGLCVSNAPVMPAISLDLCQPPELDRRRPGRDPLRAMRSSRHRCRTCSRCRSGR